MDLSYYRNEYLKDALERTDLSDSPIAQFTLWFDQAVKASLIEPNALVLSTANEQGRPSSRAVLLKAFDDRGFVFYTNFGSRKAKEMAINPYATLLAPWFGLERQVIIEGPVEKVSTTEALKYFLTRPFASQIGAWASPQSQVITTRSLVEKKVDEMKRKFADGRIPLPDFWGGFRVIPETIEFWQGGEGRLHDRFRYTRTKENTWQIDRLAP
jgi:pyridoxamine 5'-phosphate oxidase